MKTVFLDAETLGDVSLSPIASLGELVCHGRSSRAEAIERAKDADILIINKIIADREFIDASPRCRLICEAATGVNNIDTAYAASRGIEVRNVAGYSTDSVVQTTFMAILSLIGRCHEFDSHVKSGAYSSLGCFTDPSRSFFELSGRRMGIIGMGNIGSRVARVAEAFGMEVVYFSTSGTSHCSLYPSLPIEELIRSSDIVSIHAPLNDRTRGLIGRDELALMKPGAVLANMGRGGIVDEAALAEAVDSGIIAGAALDVFEKEPLPENHPFLHMRHPSRLVLLPHIAWASSQARARLVEGIADNIRSFLADKA